MRLRVRVGGRTGPLEVEGENTTLGELRAKISASLLPSLGYSPDAVFGISLNGCDPVTEAEESSLESCGFRSGDLIYLLMQSRQLAPPSPLPVPQPTPDQIWAAAHAPTPTQTPPKNMACQTQNHQREELRAGGRDSSEKLGPSTSGGAGVGEEAAPAAVASDWLSEPMLVCESTKGKIPHSLESLYLSAGCTSADDALMVVIHLLMLETGYITQGPGGKAASMPEDWHLSNGVYKLQYTHPLGGESTALLACVPMGQLLILTLTLFVNHGVKCVKKLQLPTHFYIRYPGRENDAGSVFRSLRKLSRVVKDQLIYRFLAATRQALELPDVFGLRVLPMELKLRIFRLLDVRSLLQLSATCKELRADTEDQCLWKFLYKRDFRDTTSRSPQTNWMGLYTVMYEARKSQIRRMRDFFPPPPLHPFFPEPSRSEFRDPPGIIGGEYDQRPLLPFARDPASLIIPGMRRPPIDPFHPSFPGVLPPRRRDSPGGFMLL